MSERLHSQIIMKKISLQQSWILSNWFQPWQYKLAGGFTKWAQRVFLNSDLEEEVCKDQTQGFQVAHKKLLVRSLAMAPYRLKRASRAYNIKSGKHYCLIVEFLQADNCVPVPMKKYVNLAWKVSYVKCELASTPMEVRLKLSANIHSKKRNESMSKIAGW